MRLQRIAPIFFNFFRGLDMFMQSIEKNNRRSGGTSPKNTVPEGPLRMTTVLCRKLVLSNSGVSLDVLTKEEIEREKVYIKEMPSQRWIVKQLIDCPSAAYKPSKTNI